MERPLIWLGQTFVLFYLLALFDTSFGSEFDFTVEVPAGRMSCYFQPITDPKYKSMEIDYQVIDGGDLNINFIVVFGSQVIAQDQKKVDGSHKIDITQQGDYQLCFDNTFSYQQKKIVFFEIFLYDQDGNLDELEYERLAFGDNETIARMENFGMTIEQFQTMSAKIKVYLNKAEHYQALLRSREARDRAIMDANFSRVNFWSWLNAAIMVCVGCLQVYMIRSLFEDNSRVGKLIRQTT